MRKGRETSIHAIWGERVRGEEKQDWFSWGHGKNKGEPAFGCAKGKRFGGGMAKKVGEMSGENPATAAWISPFSCTKIICRGYVSATLGGKK